VGFLAVARQEDKGWVFWQFLGRKIKGGLLAIGKERVRTGSLAVRRKVGKEGAFWQLARRWVARRSFSRCYRGK
jgi:hypothetical protein